MKIGNIQISRYSRSSKLESNQLKRVYNKFANFTMVPQAQVISILKLIKKKKIAGSVVECGVWRGGLSAAIATTLNDQRNYFLFDSFEGLPDAKPIDGEKAKRWQQDKDASGYLDNCSADQSYAEKAMNLSGSKKYQLIKGWFDESLPKHKEKLSPIAVLILDGDWYDSIKVCLENLFDLVVTDGLIIIDDYYLWDGCAKAVHEFLHVHQKEERIRSTEEGVCYIIKR